MTARKPFTGRFVARRSPVPFVERLDQAEAPKARLNDAEFLAHVNAACRAVAMLVRAQGARAGA